MKTELEAIVAARAAGRAGGQGSEAYGSSEGGGTSIEASKGNGLVPGKSKRRAR
jgi:hypothetical protein